MIGADSLTVHDGRGDTDVFGPARCCAEGTEQYLLQRDLLHLLTPILTEEAFSARCAENLTAWATAERLRVEIAGRSVIALDLDISYPQTFVHDMPLTSWSNGSNRGGS